MRGRKPKPLAVSAQRKAVHSARKPVKKAARAQAIGIGDIPAPQGLAAAAVKLWNANAPRLVAAKLLGPIDIQAFRRWCILASRFEDAGAYIREKGLVYEAVTQTGETMLRHNPAAILELRYSGVLDALDAKFGLTPGDRQRIMAERARMQGDLFGAAPPQADPAEPPEGTAPKSEGPIGLLN